MTEPAREVLRFLTLELTALRDCACFDRRKFRRRVLKGSELRQFIEQAPVAIAMFDREMRYIAVSRRWLSERCLDDSIIGRTAYEVDPDVATKFRNLHHHALQGETISRAEHQFTVAHGKKQWVRAEMRPWRDSQGDIGGIVIYSEDVTGQKQAEEALRVTEERYRYAIDAANDGIWDWDLRTNAVVYNPAYYEMLGYEASGWEDGELRLWTDLLHPEDCDRMPALARELLNAPGHYQLEFRLRARDGSYRWILSRGKVVEYDPAGAAIRAVGTHSDITDRKNAETALKESERRFRHLADTAPVMIWMSGLDKLCNYFNRTWLEFTGRTAEQEMGDGWLEGVHPDDYERCLNTYVDAFDRRQAFEMDYRLRRHDGVYRWILDRGAPRFGDQGEFHGYIGSCVDISGRKEAEDASLQRSEDRYRRIVETAQEGIWLIDAEAKTSFVNSKIVELLGYTAQEMSGRPLLAFVDDDWKDVAEQRIIDRTVGAIENHDFEFRRKDGSTLSALLSCTPIFEAGVYQGALAMVMDFTERKRLQDQLQENMRLLEENDRRKNQFLATLAHELRNPLATVNLATELVATDPGSGSADENRAALEMAVRQGKHLARLVDDLLQISRITSGKIELHRKTIDLLAVIPEAVDLVRARVEAKKLQLVVSLPREPLLAHADPVRLIQVCGNLLDNAVKFSEVSGRIVLTAAREGSDAIISIRDDGVGIDQSHLSSIFELFRQMKHGDNRNEEGLGIGLALVRQLIRLHGGEVEAYSDGVGQGSEFRLRIPLASREATREKIEMIS
jgi:PAS domain S-box-containing protein